MNREIQIQNSIESINKSISKANNSFGKSLYVGSEEYRGYLDSETEYYLEQSFIALLILLDSLDLSRSYDEFKLIYHQAKTEGFLKSEMGPDEPYLFWDGIISQYIDSISDIYGIDTITKMNKNIIEIIRESAYTITDTELFDHTPRNERDVHIRIEGILRCFFPDLKHKPSLTKPIKNFEPDTGLPSISTLIEYKFISLKNDIKKVSDQILIDTRGYISKEWCNFIYVIYETNRFQPESKWIQHLSECGLDIKTNVVVISGEPLPAKKETV